MDVRLEPRQIYSDFFGLSAIYSSLNQYSKFSKSLQSSFSFYYGVCQKHMRYNAQRDL